MGCKTLDFNEYKRKKIKESKKSKTKDSSPKYKKDGSLKQTISNSKKNRETVEPLKIEDVSKIIDYLMTKYKNSYSAKKAYTNLRNLTIFVAGINIGLRISDLLSLRWSDVYDENWEFKEYKTFTPEKTEKSNKKVILSYNEAFRKVISKFKNSFEPHSLNDIIFRKGLDDFSQLGYDAFKTILKKAAKDVGINYPVGTHSMRKTFARQRYDSATNKEEMLVYLMRIFNHSSTVITLKYIGITKEEQINIYQDVSLGMGGLDDL